MRRKQKHFYNKLTLSLMSLYLFKRVFVFAFICCDGVSDIDMCMCNLYGINGKLKSLFKSTLSAHIIEHIILLFICGSIDKFSSTDDI